MLDTKRRLESFSSEGLSRGCDVGCLEHDHMMSGDKEHPEG